MYGALQYGSQAYSCCLKRVSMIRKATAESNN
uniref:Uncharacterized protein n=1 Tax=Anguilla anguilla TaxID=7936 RepID=A0A0E9S5M1_ANGAN